MVCDWHERDAEAVHHDGWTNLAGERGENDPCETHRKAFIGAWDTVERGSSTSAPIESPASRPTRKKQPKGTHGPNAQARA